jgi:glutathione-regulated potassium-efflux system ancillary protein KefC
MTQAILFLLAALVFVPLAMRLGLGSVLGYLMAGIAIGPQILGLVSNPEAIVHVSELGVVLMLFVIGLELEPKRLWSMRTAVFGGGSLQMLACAAMLMPVGLLMGWSWQAALVASLAMALSSTAIAVAIMQERNLMTQPVGRSGFSMLLYQDIAAIPLLALAAALGTAHVAAPEASASHAQSGWVQLAAIAGVVVAGRYVAYPLMRFVARMRVRELFTAVSLLLVLGVAALMEEVGLSMGLGAFLAGVLLASSEYRHALETDILPFKGLLLGLFFIGVGMGMDLQLLASMPVQVLLGLLLVVGLKALALWGLSRWVGLRGLEQRQLAVLLSQVGEFAFVVLAAAKSSAVLPEAQANLLGLIAALSMATTPLLMMALDRWGTPATDNRPADTMEDEHPAVMLAGFGRYGQTVARMLSASGVRTTVIDHDADTVDGARRYGFKVYFGDATQADLLHAAGIAHAKTVVVAIDDAEQSLHLVRLLQQYFGHVRIVARARDALHAMELHERQVHHVQRELFESSLASARATLETLGFDRFHAKQMADHFRRSSNSFMQTAIPHRNDEKSLIQQVRQQRSQFEQEMQSDLERQAHHSSATGWHVPAPESPKP